MEGELAGQPQVEDKSSQHELESQDLPHSEFPNIPFSKYFSVPEKKGQQGKEKTPDEDSEQLELIIKEMQRLEKDAVSKENPIAKRSQEIANQLSPDKHYEVFVLTNEEINAFTIEKTQKIYLYSGLFGGLSEHLKKKGKRVTWDHVAVVIGHELSHHDDFAKRDHVAEFYCDVNGMELASKAGYNPTAVLDVLEFFDYLGGSSLIGLTHPGAGIRFQECGKVLSDPEYYLPNKLKQAEEIDIDEISGLPTVTDRQEASSAIWSSMDASELASSLGKENDQSLILERARRISDLVQAEMGRKIAMTPEFHQLLLLNSILVDCSYSYDQRRAKHLQEKAYEDHPYIDNSYAFLADIEQQLAGVTSDSQVQEVSNRWKVVLAGKIEEYRKDPDKYGYSPKRLQAALPLIEKVLAGGFKDPLAILSGASEEYKDFEAAELDLTDALFSISYFGGRVAKHNAISPSGRSQPYPIPFFGPSYDYGEICFHPNDTSA